MIQAIHFTEFVLIHGVSIFVVTKMLTYICISFLPALLPMAMLFAVLMTYGRLSQDSEIMALKATGHSTFQMLLPALLLSALISFLSAQISFRLAPWGNRQFEILIAKLEQSKATATIREGTFSEGFFDLVVYANEVNPKTGLLKKIFIYDERDGDLPLTVIAKEGKVLQDTTTHSDAMYLRLLDGDIHRQGESHTKIKFDSFDVRLFDPANTKVSDKSPASMTLDEIAERMQKVEQPPDDRRDLAIEYHKRWAFSLVCFVFALLGMGLGTTANSRHQKNNGFILSLFVVVGYWVLYVAAEGSARSGILPPFIAIWIPNVFFLGLAIWRLRLIWD
jgi:lipopolysaccharide export system permease protein